MREVKITDSKTIEVNALTRGQIKELRKKGFNLMALANEQAEDAMDAALAMVLGADTIDALDGLPYPKTLEVWRAVLIETYGEPAEEKNS